MIDVVLLAIAGPCAVLSVFRGVWIGGDLASPHFQTMVLRVFVAFPVIFGAEDGTAVDEGAFIGTGVTTLVFSKFAFPIEGALASGFLAGKGPDVSFALDGLASRYGLPIIWSRAVVRPPGGTGTRNGPMAGWGRSNHHGQWRAGFR